MEFPKKCPYCGKDIVENRKDYASQETTHFTSKVGQKRQVCEIHQCIHCKEYFFVIKDVFHNGEIIEATNVILYYPAATAIDFPKRIKELSPTAYKTYEQAIQAKEHGMNMLVGAGLRIALEWLVWDYLIKIKGLPETDIEKLTLAKRIEKMNSDFYTQVCTRLIRLFGNDSVHIIKQLDFSADEVIEVFDMLCSLIDNELQIKEVNDRLSSPKVANET